MIAMTFSPFWCLYPEKPMPSPPFWPRCWSRRHGARADRGASRPRDAAHWPQTPATATHHPPTWQRLCRRSCSEWPVSRGVCRHGQALPLHARVEHPEDQVKDAVIAQFALWPALGHREMRQDKCAELGSESWTGIGVVAGFAAVVFIVEGPHVSKGDATQRIKLL